MLKRLLILSMLLAFCCCAESNELLTEETRAKKKKKTFRLIVMVLLFLFSKVAIFKVASFFFFFAFFQKLFALGGVLLTYMMKNQAQVAASQPISMYGPPTEYNTVGYSYGPPDHEPVHEGPSITDFGGAFNWLAGKQ